MSQDQVKVLHVLLVNMVELRACRVLHALVTVQLVSYVSYPLGIHLLFQTVVRWESIVLLERLPLLVVKRHKLAFILFQLQATALPK